MIRSKLKVVFIFFSLVLLFCLIPVTASSKISIEYQSHLQDLGWISVKSNGSTSGTVGESRRMEAIAISIKNDVDATLSYKVHVQDYGWLPIVSDGIIAGTVGESKRMEAIVIYLNNSKYTLKYRVHVQNIGWMEWKNSGEIAGTTGESKRIEAIQIILEYKGVIIENKNIYSGIDVSKYQKEIDWEKVHKSKIDFAIIRAGYRGSTEGKITEDPYFSQNVNGAFENGIDVGLYFYTSAINEAEAEDEANYVLNLIKKYGFENKISYPIAIDIEDLEGSRSNFLNNEERTNIVNKFCDVIREAGYIPMVYSYTYFLEYNLNMDNIKNTDVWIADYYGNTWYKRDYLIWQYTSSGSVDGINGAVDLNYCKGF